MKIFLVEDEPIALRRLQNMLYSLNPQEEVVGTAGSVEQAVKWLKQNPSPDLMLLDIELSDGQSFDIFKQVAVPCPVIFITAYDSYALQAFKVNSIDYLLKPIDEHDLQNSLQKLREMQHLFTKGQQQTMQVQQLVDDIRKQLQNDSYKERFLIRTGDRYHTVEADEVAFFKADEKVVSLHSTANKKFIVNYSLDELEKMLHPKCFFRANRQFIIAHKSVHMMHAGFNGKLNIIIKTTVTQEVVVSRERASAFKAWLGE